MKISSNFNLNFASLNNPIQPFDLKTQKGELHFEEINYLKPINESTLKSFAELTLDTEAENYETPRERTYKKDDFYFNEIEYSKKIESIKSDTRKVLQNPDTTLLIGRNKKHKICATIHSYPLNLLEEFKDNKTLYIDSIAIEKQYRSMGIGTTLMKKIIDSSKGSFKEIFLASMRHTRVFYEKLGFKRPHKEEQRKEIQKIRPYYPTGVSFFSKEI